jgi:hypothetical protein
VGGLEPADLGLAERAGTTAAGEGRDGERQEEGLARGHWDREYGQAVPAPRPSHIPVGHDPGSLTRDYPISDGALPRMFRPALSGVTVALPRTEYRRGEAVEPEVAGGEPELAVGLVCTERYLDVARELARPVPVSATEWESWLSLADGPPSFVIPATAPYSHEGTVLSLSWSIVVRGPRRMRLDRTIRTPIWVSP